jgi:hypothetical protein
MRLALSVGLALWTVLAVGAVGCGDKAPAKATRAECMQVAEHIADLIMDHFTKNPDEWWDSFEGTDSGLPPTVQKATFKAYLDTPEGKTWLMQRRGNTLSGTKEGVDTCVAQASRALAACLIAAKSKDDVVACDAKHGKTGSPTSPGSGEVGSGSSVEGSGATPGSAESK